MVASVILNCEPLIGLTKMVEKSNSNKSKVNSEEKRRDVVGLLFYILVSFKFRTISQQNPSKNRGSATTSIHYP